HSDRCHTSRSPPAPIPTPASPAPPDLASAATSVRSERSPSHPVQNNETHQVSSGWPSPCNLQTAAAPPRPPAFASGSSPPYKRPRRRDKSDRSAYRPIRPQG